MVALLMRDAVFMGVDCLKRRVRRCGRLWPAPLGVWTNAAAVRAQSAATPALTKRALFARCRRVVDMLVGEQLPRIC